MYSIVYKIFFVSVYKLLNYTTRPSLPYVNRSVKYFREKGGGCLMRMNG